MARLGQGGALAALLMGSAAMLAGSVSDAEAGAFAIREQSAYSQGASFAGNAVCGDSIQGAFWNPAVIGCAQYVTTETSYSLVVPDSQVNTSAGSTFPGFGSPGDIGELALIPSSAFAAPIYDDVSIGFTVNGPFGLATQTNFNHAGQVYARRGEIFSLAFTPTVAWQVTPEFIIGGGVTIQYFDLVELTTATGVLPGSPSATLSGSDVGFGFTLGALFRPMPGTEVGIGYRSEISHTLEGSVRTPIATIPVTAGITTPDTVTASIRQQVTDDFALLGSIEWTNWQDVGTIQILAPTGATVSTLPLNYDDGWFFALGGEYDYSDVLTLRAGAAWEVSPIDTSVRNISLPDDDRLWLSIGGTYQYMDELTINAGYSFITTFDTNIAIQPGHQAFVGPTFLGSVDTQIHIFAVGAKWEFVTGAPAPLDEPLVVKH